MQKFLVLTGIFITILVLFYFLFGKTYLEDKEATRMYSFANSLVLRSSPMVIGDQNALDNIKYGSEVLVYEYKNDWVECKFNGKKGFVRSKHLLNKKDFHELNAILSDEITRFAVNETRYKKAILNYFRKNNYAAPKKPDN
jgi:hypothetical protein